MSTRTAWLLGGLVIFGACAGLLLMTPSLSGPPEIRVTPPAPELPAELAAFSGVWEFGDGQAMADRVVVERIDETRATLLLTGRNHPPRYPAGGWERVKAQVLPDGRLQWGYPVRFILRLAADGATLEAERAGAATRMTLRKVESWKN